MFVTSAGSSRLDPGIESKNNIAILENDFCSSLKLSL